MPNKDGSKSGGRKKGTPNKSTTAVKNALIEAFDKLGGVDALTKWGQDEPTEFYKLWVKVLPVQTNEIITNDSEVKRIEIITVEQNTNKGD